jgi:hypothetical protein
MSEVAEPEEQQNGDVTFEGEGEQEFRCKEPGCPLSVRYVPDPIQFLAKKHARAANAALTCDNGHTHMYIINR